MDWGVGGREASWEVGRRTQRGRTRAADVGEDVDAPATDR